MTVVIVTLCMGFLFLPYTESQTTGEPKLNLVRDVAIYLNTQLVRISYRRSG